MSCKQNFGLSGAVAGLELLRESSAGILPAVASAAHVAGGRDARRTAAGTAALQIMWGVYAGPAHQPAV